MTESYMAEEIIRNLAEVKPGDRVMLKGGHQFYRCLDNISNATEPDDGEHWHLQIAYEPHPWEIGSGTEWVPDSLFEYALRYQRKDLA